MPLLHAPCDSHPNSSPLKKKSETHARPPPSTDTPNLQTSLHIFLITTSHFFPSSYSSSSSSLVLPVAHILLSNLRNLKVFCHLNSKEELPFFHANYPSLPIPSHLTKPSFLSSVHYSVHTTHTLLSVSPSTTIPYHLYLTIYDTSIKFA